MELTMPDSSTSTMQVYDPKNWRHTKRELARYSISMRSTFCKTQFYTLSDPDATKIGTQLSISASLLGDSATEKLAIGHPQEFLVLLAV